jgi:hypothetical protein
MAFEKSEDVYCIQCVFICFLKNLANQKMFIAYVHAIQIIMMSQEPPAYFLGNNCIVF